MSAGAEREPLTATLSVEEGRAARRLDSFEEDAFDRPRMSVLEIANKYAGLAVCIAAAVVVVCALSGVAMIGSMHANLTPESLAGAAANKLLGGASGPAAAALAGGQGLDLSIWPERYFMDVLADAMQVDWSPMFRKLAAAWESSGRVYEGVAADLVTNPPSQDDPVAGMVNSGLLEAATNLSSFMRTAAEAARMLSTTAPPAKGTAVSAAELGKDSVLLERLLGLNAVEDEDGDASMPLAAYLARTFDPKSLQHLAESCVELAERVDPAGWSMHVYTPSDAGFTGACIPPDDAGVFSVANPWTGEPMADELPWGSGPGDGSAATTSYDFKCSVLGHSQTCMCSAEVSLEKEVTAAQGVKDVCQMLARLLAKQLGN